MKVKFNALLATGLLFALFALSGCLEQQPEQQSTAMQTEMEEENNMDDAMIQDLVERFLSRELSNHELEALEFDVLNEVLARLDEILFPTEEEREAQRIIVEEQMRNTVAYIFTANRPLASINTDLNTIERFIFVSGVPASRSFNVVIDRMFGRVYHDNNFLIQRQLDRAAFSAEFINEDLTRLIEAIENSDMRNWQEYYEGSTVSSVPGGSFWQIGIEFSDGSVMRRSGSGQLRDHFPPQHQWDIFMDFINDFAREIIERHNAENPQTNE